VPIAKDTVKEAPQFDATGQLTKSEETDLYTHYGLEQLAPPET
jgi:hypothetical protein